MMNDELLKTSLIDLIDSDKLLKVGRCSKYSINHNYFDVIDHQDKAYILGLLWADGTHDTGRRCIRLSLHEKDEEILLKIRECLKSDKPISSSKQMRTLEIVGENISNQLMKYGLVPRKTFLARFPLFISSDFYRDFIRGYFDGDGSIWFPKHKKMLRKASCIGIVGTESLCISIDEIVSEELGIHFGFKTRFPQRMNNTRQIEFGGNIQVKKFMDWLYRDANLFLKRKHDKYMCHFYGQEPCIP